MSTKIILERMKALFSDDPALLQKYQRNTLGVKKDILGVFFPESVDDVVEIVTLANELKLQLYPISAGKNWGYGNGSPVSDHSFIVDMSKMNKIRAFDESLGVITLEAGVTVEQLTEFLEKQNARFICPVNGAGPRVSIVGNLLEKGTSVSGPAVEMLRAIEAVLPNGELYKNPLWTDQTHNMALGYRWGVGPYLDGLFLQGSFGIVTSITLALPPLQKYQGIFYIPLKKMDELEAIFQSTNTINHLIGRNYYFTLHLSNQLLYLDESIKSFLLSQKLIHQETCCVVSTWIEAGDEKVYLALSEMMMTCYKKNGITPILIDFRPFFFGEKWISKCALLKKWFPSWVNRRELVSAFVDQFTGHANEAKLTSFYHYANIPLSSSLQPEQDGLGIIWFTTIILSKASFVKAFYEMVEKICTVHGFDPIFVMYSINQTALQGFVSILFDLNNPEKIAASDRCYQALLEAGKLLGFTPCRIPVSQMENAVDQNKVYWKCVNKIKHVLDPNNMISYKRYS